MKISKTKVKIEGLRLYAHHGVLPVERVVGNEFEVSLDLFYDAFAAMNSDSISKALNYAEVIRVVKREMAVPSSLLENVAMRIASSLENSFMEITAGRITIRKIKPPISEEMDSVGFTMKWTR